MFQIVFHGVTLTPPTDFIREVLSLLGVEDLAEVTIELFLHLGFVREKGGG